MCMCMHMYTRAYIFMTIFTGQIYRFPFISHPDYCLYFTTTTTTTTKAIAVATASAAPVAITEKNHMNLYSEPDAYKYTHHQ